MGDMTNPSVTPYDSPGVPLPFAHVYCADSTVEVLDDEMLLTQSFRDGVLFAHRMAGGELIPAGTVFVVSDPVPGLPDRRWVYLVTARHVIEGIRHKSAEDDSVYLRVNNKDGTAHFVRVPITAWLFHPSDNSLITGKAWMTPTAEIRYDVAVASCPDAVARIVRIAATDFNFVDDALMERENVAVGDDLAIVGLYNKHVGKNRNIPIVRSGMIAAMPEPGELVATQIGPMEVYLIETRSTSGLSGSPVFWTSGFHRVGPDGVSRTLPMNLFRLLGFVHGRYNSPRESEWLSDGIALVVPARHIVETLRQEVIMAAREDEERRLREEAGVGQHGRTPGR
jgi:hypothetical protein